jgi:hypothetical protein
MAVQLDHLIVFPHDKHESVRFLAELLGSIILSPPGSSSRSMSIQRSPSTLRNRAWTSPDSTTRSSSARTTSMPSSLGSVNVACRSGPTHTKRRLGEINRNDGGRGLYFDDLAGHGLEIMTQGTGR